MEYVSENRLAAPAVATGDILVKAPPDVRRPAAVNPLARLMPAVMVVAAVGMVVVYLRSGQGGVRSPMLMLFPVMMLASLVGTVAYSARGAGGAAEINEDRREYLHYIAELDAAAAATAVRQHESLHWTHPDPSTLWTLAGTARMWERRPADADFCRVRVGLGAGELSTRLVMPELGRTGERDPVTCAALRRVMRHRSHVADLPRTVAVCAHPRVAIDGDERAARRLLRAVVCQLAALHSPEHLKIAVVVREQVVREEAVRAGAAGEDEAGEWDWLKWLPHHQHPTRTDAAGQVRMTYPTPGEAAADLCTTAAGKSVHAVLLVDGDATALAELGGIPGVTALAVGCNAPAGLHLRVDAEGLLIGGDSGVAAWARPDAMTRDQAETCARRLARYRSSAENVGGLSAPPDWAGLVGIDPSRIDPATLWRIREPRRRLRVPIGVADDGTVVELDLKEAAHHGMGPHGLCIGATGSGKSEFLRTLTLGLVATHPPDALNLILVDFKGGATFPGFDRLSHVASVITNLADEAQLVARMKDALAGELNRRQEALRAAGSVADIAEYARARTRDPSLAPLPAVLIVVDEFSELLSQHPDFAELFVAIGRLGRSLGMHLLLASQRLDEGRLRGLETHLSYRICLKTFSASESRAVLGIPDAAQLPADPGVAYLRTASGELTRFRTAFVSGRAGMRSADVLQGGAGRPQPFGARPVRLPATENQSSQGHACAPTVLESVLDRLSGHGVPAHPVWLAPLRGSPPLDAVLTPIREPLSVAVGLVDRPFEQRRDPLLISLAGRHGNAAVVGGPGSGKSTALRALVLALAATHGPQEVQIYCIDLGGGALSSLRPLPHVGAVAGRLDVDLVRRTVAELESLVRSRDCAFRQMGVDSMTEYRRLRAAGDPTVADDPFGDVFLVIDGWATLRHDFEDLEARITSLLAQGLSFGVHVVIAASRWAEIRPAIKDQLGSRIELRLGDPAESEMDRRRARDLGDCPPGRGITHTGHEFVLALPRLDGHTGTAGLTESIAASADLLARQHRGRCAPPIELLPAHIRHDSLDTVARARRATQIVLGLDECELRPAAIDFDEQPHLIILGEARCGKTATLRTLCTDIVHNAPADSAQLMIVDFRRTLLGVVESAHLRGYAMSATALTSQLKDLLEVLTARMPGDGVTQQQLRARSWWSGPEIYVVVDDYDLVAGATGNPLNPLIDLLPHAGDLGLHVVLARRSGGAARAMFDPLLARMKDLGCMGLIMSGSPEEGVLFGTVRPGPLPPGRATLVTRARPAQLVQIAWCDPP